MIDKPLIELKSIKKVYNAGRENELSALKGIDIEIKHGEFVAIMGPSGSGKSTLMNILGALDTPTSGKYLLEGEDVSTYNDSQLADFRNQQVGFVFQQFNLLPRLTIRENVLLPTLYGELDDAMDKALEMLDKVGIGDKLDYRPNQLSGGQIQRVAIARALIMSPAIIMADEPTGNLDSRTAVEIMDILKALNFDGNTIILVTHDDAIAEYANRIIRIKDGKVE